MESFGKVEIEPNLLEILMDEHLAAIKRDTIAALDRFEKSGLEFNMEFMNSFLKQSFDCLKQSCIKFRDDAKLTATRDGIATFDETATETATETPDSEAEYTTIPLLATGEVSDSMDQGGKSLKRKAEDALNDNAQQLKRRKTMESTVNCDKNGDSKYQRHILFFCVHCLNEETAAKSFRGTIDDVWKHWLSEHVDEWICKKFQFHPVALVKCFHCEEVGTFHDLVNHYKEHHPAQQFTIIDRENMAKCGICYFRHGDMVKHFKAKHKSVTKLKCFNPIIYSEKQIQQFLSIDFNHIVCDDRMKPDYLICGFCQKKVVWDTFLHHFDQHSYSFKCSYCTFDSANLVELVLHKKNSHDIDSLNYHCSAFLKWIRVKFLNTDLVFGNGLILKNFNVARTKLDTSKQFDDFINDFLNKKKMEVKTQFESDENVVSNEAPMQVYIEIE